MRKRNLCSYENLAFEQIHLIAVLSVKHLQLLFHARKHIFPMVALCSAVNSV